jgi:cytochrome P450
MPMVKTTAKDWNAFSSDAPFRVPIPSDEKVRNVRQLSIVTNPPAHTEFRNTVEPYFKPPRDAECWEFVFLSRAQNTLKSRSGKGKRGLSPGQPGDNAYFAAGASGLK